ncbi:Glycosyltransferase 61 [Trypanosoma melophagium]|uniref:Glycosyltransferase 61 n=1 Tax=Trypanosoma melophagium TaxID=715481 RepID=UPI003519FA8D|nr:Glycosyltransferase 61 [Trypanosoma melophagium]
MLNSGGNCERQPSNLVMNRQRRGRLGFLLFTGGMMLFLSLCSRLYFLLETQEESTHREVRTAGVSGVEEKFVFPFGEEPDMQPWVESILNAVAHNNSPTAVYGCGWYMAPTGETMRLVPACSVGDDDAKPRCSSEELSTGSMTVNGGATRAQCVMRGRPPKCYTENIIMQRGEFFTFAGGNLGIPETLFLSDGTAEGVMRYHHYYGNSVREVASAADRGPSILSHCKYVVNTPVVFLYRVSGHNTFHLWANNLGPFFSTLHDDFGLETATKGLGGLFRGKRPVIITVDDKPHQGPKAPLLLDELLSYFTDFPVLNASEFTEPTCFTQAILGIGANQFSQSELRQWMIPRVAMRHRLLQLLSVRNGEDTSSTTAPTVDIKSLRCLVSLDDAQLPTVAIEWMAWKLRHWQKLPYRPRVVYLSRNHPNITRGRKVVNEADVLPALELVVLAMTGRKLQRVFLEEMAYVDQIMMMSETNILIAPHGGGIANCVWMPPGSVVVEFVSPAGEDLLNMYHRQCRDAAGRAALPIEHIPFLAKQDPAERQPGYAKAHPSWVGNKKLFSNIWLPKDKLLKHVVKAITLYNQLVENAKSNG